jgi:hypothetical protein
MLMTLSRRFIETLKLHDEPAYKVAWRAGLHPAILSKLIHGAERVRPNDARILAVGRQLGLAADDCFEAEEGGPPRTASPLAAEPGQMR